MYPPKMSERGKTAKRKASLVPSTSNTERSVQEQQQQQKRRHRTKTGCFTCRARRKKCDETRDAQTGACSRCLNSGFECLGFPSLKRAPPSAHLKRTIAEADERSILPTSSSHQRQISLTAQDKENSITVDHVRNQGEDTSSERCEQAIARRSIKDLATLPLAPIATLTMTETQVSSSLPFFWASPPLSQQYGQDRSNNVYTEVQGNWHTDVDAHLQSPRVERRDEECVTQPVDLTRMDNVDSFFDAANLFDSLMTSDFFEGTPSIQVARETTLTTLSKFYSMVGWYRFQLVRRNYTKDQLVAALKGRLQGSEVLCISVASVAACYGFSNYIKFPDDNTRLTFSRQWTDIFHFVTTRKSVKLLPFLDCIGELTNLMNRQDHSLASEDQLNQNGKTPSPGQHVKVENKSQGEVLFSLASKVLQKIALTANQDQEIPHDRNSPLERQELEHIDEYLQAAMDLALYTYASRSSKAFTVQFESATLLLNSLVGQSQSVRLSDLQGVDISGYRAYVWADIVNAVLSGRSTNLYYLSDEDHPYHAPTAQMTIEDDEKVDEVHDGNEEEVDDGSLYDSDGEEEEEEQEKGGGKGGRSCPRSDLRNCFGCPDDILVIMASIANLHFQLSQARKSGNLAEKGVESIPAWALYTASKLGVQIERSQERDDDARQARHLSLDCRSNTDQIEHQALCAMWRHAAVIFLHTTVYRQGPLSTINQERLQAILEIYSNRSIGSMTDAMGDPALPLLFAAFVAVSKEDRAICMKALQEFGQKEVGREDYRRFVKKLWKNSDLTGFVALWQDFLVESGETIAIM